ncbi:hypothetical protein PsorP6_007985 [Peronosclerospora sorghi]|uniref:Uncharacterized protein n=1 Tax=Peronosclerospora sorghi TaxID=230839 RepID=A0ACC0W9B1_9STRA|nr:hypothetical protein PsorP6_007985 [Peronosclerospora sorghi]
MRKTIASLVLAAAVLEGKIAGSSAATGELSNLGATNFDQSYRLVGSRMLRGKKQIDDKEELDGEADDEERVGFFRGARIVDLPENQAEEIVHIADPVEELKKHITKQLQIEGLEAIHNRDQLVEFLARASFNVPAVDYFADIGGIKVGGMEITKDVAKAYRAKVEARFDALNKPTRSNTVDDPETSETL